MSLFVSFLLFVLAGLISYGTGCLTCRLTGCLALAASALLQRILQRLGIQCLNMLHSSILLMQLFAANGLSARIALLAIVSQNFRK